MDKWSEIKEIYKEKRTGKEEKELRTDNLPGYPLKIIPPGRKIQQIKHAQTLKRKET